jgi:HK97 family phage portal protein
MLRGRMPGEEKGLSVSLEPNGFVTEIRDYRQQRYPDAGTASAQEAQQRNELVFACVEVKATSAQGPRLVVQQAKMSKGKTTWEEVPGHPMRQLLMRPNQDMTEADLMQAAIVSWDVSNPRRFYAEKEFTGGLLTALHPLNPVYIHPLMSQANTRNQIGYVWYDGVERKEYAFEDILVRKAPAWYDPPPIVAAMGNIDLDTGQTDHIRAFFANGGIPPGLLKYKNMKLRKDQRDEVREQWRSTYGAAFGRQHDIGVLDGEVEYQEIGANLDKLASPTLRMVSEARICMAFGVPPLIVYAYVGLLRATYSNLKEAWRGFWDHPMWPQFCEWREFFLYHLLTEFEEERDVRAERIRLFYDMSAVAAFQEDIDAVQARAEKAWRAGGMTRAEYRQALGQQPDANDNFYILPAGMMVVPAGMMPDGGMPTPPKQHQNGREKADATV